ncbi:hypothetical protein [Microcoleus sp. D2_18a_D3]|uniref:hypothetical protein n=1 Tax=Microcoleus sp. D2_18a_D3 TaxID=3055330 RepID=UPI002FD55CA0
MSQNDKSIKISGGTVYSAGNSASVYGAVNIGSAANNQFTRQQTNQGIYYLYEEKEILLEAAAEIKQLLEHLEKMNPTATEAEKIEYVNDETTRSFKRRVVGALQAGGEAAIEEFLDNPYVNVGKAIVKGWIKPE